MNPAWDDWFKVVMLSRRGLSLSLRRMLAALQAAHPEPVPIATFTLVLWPDQPELRIRENVLIQIALLRETLATAGGEACVVEVAGRNGDTAYRLVRQSTDQAQSGTR